MVIGVLASSISHPLSSHSCRLPHYLFLFLDIFYRSQFKLKLKTFLISSSSLTRLLPFSRPFVCHCNSSISSNETKVSFRSDTSSRERRKIPPTLQERVKIGHLSNYYFSKQVHTRHLFIVVNLNNMLFGKKSSSIAIYNCYRFNKLKCLDYFGGPCFLPHPK